MHSLRKFDILQEITRMRQIFRHRQSILEKVNEKLKLEVNMLKDLGQVFKAFRQTMNEETIQFVISL